VLYQEIVALDYVGGQSQLHALMRTFEPAQALEPLVRFETAPGEQMQVDWVEFRKGATPLYAFCATPGYSRASHVEFVTEVGRRLNDVANERIHGKTVVKPSTRLRKGLVGLLSRHAGGRPPKLSEEEDDCASEIAATEALTPAGIHQRLRERHPETPRVGPGRLAAYLEKRNFSFKRCRLPLKNKRPEQEFAEKTSPRSVHHAHHDSSRRKCGNRITSRILGESVINIIRRSMPIPQPPVGGNPYSSARM